MKFLVFQHVPHEPLGLIAKFADKHGIKLDIIELWKDYKIPHAKDYDALVIMGGPMGVYEGNDIYPSRDDEVAFIQKHIGTLPMIGFCLGAQLLAYVLGAKVYPNKQNNKTIKEIGFYDIDLSEKGKVSPLFAGFDNPVKVLLWHGDIFELPNDADHLASSPITTNQAFSCKNAFGLLFHCEFTPEMLTRLTEIDKKWTHTDFDLDEEQFLKDAKKYEKLMEEQNTKLFSNFLSIIKK